MNIPGVFFKVMEGTVITAKCISYHLGVMQLFLRMRVEHVGILGFGALVMYL